MLKKRIAELAAAAAFFGAVGCDEKECPAPIPASAEVGVASAAPDAKPKILEQKGLTEAEIKFRNEHPIESEVREVFASKQVLSEQQSKQLVNLPEYVTESFELVRDNRFPNAEEEKKTFQVVYDQEKWKSHLKSIRFASEKTGVPLRVLIAMGFIESKFDPKAVNTKTMVYGPYQMKLATAQQVARSAKEVYGFPIKVESEEDLKDVKTGVRLAALYLKQLKSQYGQLGLAIAAYSSGDKTLEDKIEKAFPKTDLGAKEWKEMERFHLAETKAKQTYDQLLKLMNTGMASNDQLREMRKVAKEFSAQTEAYKKAKATWLKKRSSLAQTWQNDGVTLLGLYAHAKKSESVVPHSLSYPLALDQIAALAHKHAELAKVPQKVVKSEKKR